MDRAISKEKDTRRYGRVGEERRERWGREWQGWSRCEGWCWSSLSLQADFLMESACYRTSNTALPDGGGANSRGKIWLATSTAIPRPFVYFQTVWVCPSEEQRGSGCLALLEVTRDWRARWPKVLGEGEGEGQCTRGTSRGPFQLQLPCTAWRLTEEAIAEVEHDQSSWRGPGWNGKE